MTAQLSDRGGWRGAVDRGMGWLPARLRRGTAVVPVVRLSGVIGAVTPLRPGMTLGECRENARKGVRDQERAGGRAGHQFARRLAGAVAPDLFAHPPARPREEPAGDGVRRGRRGVRRLHDRLRRRRDLLRPVVDPRIDRRGRRLLRHDRADQEDRRRAPALHRGRAQGDARSVPARGSRRRRAAEIDPARDPRASSSTSSRRAAARG